MNEREIAPDEATRQVETLLNLKREDVLTVEEVKGALKNMEYYRDIIKAT